MIVPSIVPPVIVGLTKDEPDDTKFGAVKIPFTVTFANVALLGVTVPISPLKLADVIAFAVIDPLALTVLTYAVANLIVDEPMFFVLAVDGIIF